MKGILCWLLAAGLAAAAPLAGAATPKAAEDASSPVTVSDTPPPRVKPATAAQGKEKPARTAKKGAAKKGGAKKAAANKGAKAKSRKARAKR
jgi:hypothetical protein